MQDWQQRVIDEKNELVAKIDKLATFLESDATKGLDELTMYIMTRQAGVMAEYANLLALRIRRFK